MNCAFCINKKCIKTPKDVKHMKRNQTVCKIDIDELNS